MPFSVNRLDIKATAEDSTAKVSISNPELPAGGSANVTVTVTAASGAQKIYTIKSTRAQDPNYVPGNNADLASLSVDGFILSPAFSPEKAEYAVYLPFEIENINIQAAAADSKADVVNISGQDNLQVGVINLIEISVAAEDGSTKIYTITAIRAEEFTGLVDPGVTDPEPTPLPSVTETEPTAIPTSSESVLTEETKIEMQESNEPASSAAKTIVIVILSVLLLAATGILVWLFAVKHIRI